MKAPKKIENKIPHKVKKLIREENAMRKLLYLILS